MATVGKRSEYVLQSVNPVLGNIVRMALIAAPPWLDFAVVSGDRTAEEQYALWCIGRTNGGDTVDPAKVVTYRDGTIKKSNHQSGNALDIVAYRDGNAVWTETANAAVAGYVIGFAAAKGIKLGGGVKWLWDYGHLELG